MSEIKTLDVEVSFPDILDVDVDFGQTLTKIVAPDLGGMTFVGFSMDNAGHVLVTNSDRLGTTSFELTQSGHMAVTY